VEVPSQPHAPCGTCVRTFAVREQAPFVWIWLGQPGAAALRQPPRTPWFDDPAWASTGSLLQVEANYMLLHEHYLDLTNVFVMHPEAVPPGIEELPPLDAVEVSEMSVAYSRVLPAARLADWEAEATGLPRDTECRRREEGTFVSPALHTQRYTIEPAGQPAFELVRVQGFTPESATATHVFLRMVRNYATDRAVVAEHLQKMFDAWAARDATVLERLQRSMTGDPGNRRDVNVKADRAAVRARRVARSMVEEEAGRAAGAARWSLA
jgi:vanillate O-demethylase monooxygenase subunit